MNYLTLAAILLVLVEPNLFTILLMCACGWGTMLDWKWDV